MLIEIEALVTLITFVSVMVFVYIFIIHRLFVDAIIPLYYFFVDFIYDKIAKKIKAKKQRLGN